MLNYKGGNGTSLKRAIKIVGARSEREGIMAEYFLVHRCFDIIEKNWILISQGLYHVGERYYDRLTLQDEDGKISEMWFDISDFFGQL